MLAPGKSRSTIGRIVAAPSTRVSSRPRRCSMRSVKTWPRSKSAASWISSTARNATSRSRGMASTVATQKRGLGGLIFSSPVISATASAPDPLDGAVVDFARQQPQRQADHPGRMRQHPLDGEMGLAGIGRPEHGGDAGAAGAHIAVGGRGKRNRHCRPGLAASLPWPLAGQGQDRGSICITTTRRKVLCLTCGTSSGTNRGRIGDSRRVRFRSPRHMARPGIWQYQIGCLRQRRTGTSSAKRLTAQPTGFCCELRVALLWITGTTRYCTEA